MTDETTPAEQVAASSPPVGVSTQHILIVALAAIALFAFVAGWTLTHNADASDRAAILQATIAMATMAFGYYLGSSAGSRNKDHRE